MRGAPARVGVRERLLEFLANYGERGLAVVRAAVEAALAGRGSPGVRLGDFSYREVVARLRSWGVDYNPSMLLRILERDYGVIETTYRSSNQHWWRFLDLNAVLEALEAYEKGSSPLDDAAGEGVEGEELDPELELLRAQVAALDLPTVLATLRRLAAKQRLSRQDRLVFRRIVFGELAEAVRLLERIEGVEGLEEEAEMIREAVRLASRIARRLLAEQRAVAPKTGQAPAEAGAEPWAAQPGWQPGSQP